MRTPLLFLFLASASLAAQTARPPVHHTAPVHRTESECAKLPEISSTIPALTAGTPCPRPLFTVTQTPSLHADYISPMVDPALRAVLDPQPIVISLVYADEKVGAGPLVEQNKYTEVLYTGYLPNGTVFDSNTDAAKPFGFVLGGHHVIPGWDMGLDGMHIGGKRRLFIPYQLAYGDRGSPPRIPGKSMLIFDIEVLKQSDTPPAPPEAMRPMPRPAPPAAKPAPSPAGTTAPPPITSTTPPASTQPTPPSSEPKK